MKSKEIKLSAEFKSQATKAIVAICIFVFTYLTILLLAVGFTILCIMGGIYIIAAKPMILTIALGIGLASLGVLVLIFLLKFIFKSHTVDRSHLIEINEQQEPKLFSMIQEIVKEVGTSFPKKVYLSADVNASVFYDSSFWSMFLPVKKNLQIGLGLVNTITKEELKAILSHEFGHFSQRTMKVGSFVYNLNQIIFNMLFDNQSYTNLIQTWSDVSGYFSIFVVIAVKINEGIQWILKKLYEVVNKSYMGLSREMEFHADEIAASVTGYEPLKKSLLRMTLADNSFNNVLNYYNEKISKNIKSESIYQDQTAVMYFLAETNSFPIANSLPDISIEEQSKFDKSKLVIKDQWASHPTVEERIKRLEQTGNISTVHSDTLANDVFVDIVKLQKQLTKKVFESVKYKGVANAISSDKFIEDYKQEALSNSFSKKYNGYYDIKNPVSLDLDKEESLEATINFNDLFSDEKVDVVYTAFALNNDIEMLKSISNNKYVVKTFDYDGKRYKKKNAAELAEKLKEELNSTNEKIKNNDIDIFRYFNGIENIQNKPKELKRFYQELFEFDKQFDKKQEIYTTLTGALQFVSVVTPFEEIRKNFSHLKPIEENLKQEIKQLLADPIFTTEINDDIKEQLEKYIGKTRTYFNGTHYLDENLNILYSGMHSYAYLLSRKYFLLKKALLNYQAELV